MNNPETGVTSGGARLTDAEDVFPLSRTQAGLLFHAARDRDVSMYHDLIGWPLRRPFEATTVAEQAVQIAGDARFAAHVQRAVELLAGLEGAPPAGSAPLGGEQLKEKV